MRLEASESGLLGLISVIWNTRQYHQYRAVSIQSESSSSQVAVAILQSRSRGLVMKMI